MPTMIIVKIKIFS